MNPRGPNPFQGNMVSDAWETGVDVGDIHKEDFELCLRAVDFVRQGKQTTSVLVHGEPGAGKTHLLSRVRGHLVGTGDASSERLGQCLIYVYLRSSAGRLWRSFRRRFVEELLRDTLTEGRCQWEWLLRNRLAGARQADGDLDEWWEFFLDDENLDGLLDTLDDLLNHSELAKVLAAWLRKRDRRIARAWLRGDGISESERNALGLSNDEPEDAETEAKQVVVALCRLASPKMPLVFCFDQIEALEMDPGDNTGLFQFGQMARELKIETQNTVLITCVQTQFLDRFRQACSQWAYDSLREFGVCFLDPLNLSQARRLMEARLAALRIQNANGQPAFHLTDQQLGRIVGEGGCTPRKLLAHLARLYDGEALTEEQTPEEFLSEQWDRLEEQAEKHSDPAELADILAAALPALLQLTGGCKPEAANGQKDIEFSLVHPDGKIGVSLCTQSHLTSLAARLRRLLEILKTDNPWHKVILFRHPQMPIGKPGQKSKVYWDDLQQHGAVAVYPSLKTIAALKALRDLLAAAD